MRIIRNSMTCALLMALIAGTAAAERFLADDPIRVDPDQVSIPEPSRHEAARAYDFFLMTFFDPGGSHKIPAQNINTLGEVPDSSWFTNRIGSRSMGLEEIAKGPNHEGPDVQHTWTVVKAKTDGASAGFVIKDARGDTYYVKLDSPETPELQSAAEVISTKIFYAIGYNVPENYVVYLKPEQLKVKPYEEGHEPSMDQNELMNLLSGYPRRKDGRIRMVASLQIKGKPLGGFRFFGTRSDDANDIIPHENRRELRGYRLFAAWLNHGDSDSKNTFDAFVSQGSSSYVKHYLLDFGTTLGSAAVGKHNESGGYEYRFDPVPMVRTAATLGIWDRPWMHIKYPDYPAVGSIEADHFDAARWKPDFPNPAFERMQLNDAFWAAKIVFAFSDEQVKAIVKTAEISDPEAESYLIQTLIKRRDNVVSTYFSKVNPVADFRIDGSQISFRNLGEEAGLGKTRSYEYQWFRFDNAAEALTPIGDVRSGTRPALDVPTDPSSYLMVRIRSICAEQTSWGNPVDVYIRNGTQKVVVGIERKN